MKLPVRQMREESPPDSETLRVDSIESMARVGLDWLTPMPAR